MARSPRRVRADDGGTELAAGAHLDIVERPVMLVAYGPQPDTHSPIGTRRPVGVGVDADAIDHETGVRTAPEPTSVPVSDETTITVRRHARRDVPTK
jgi:hypothetical protein